MLWSEELGQYNMIHSAGMPDIARFVNYDITRTPVTKDHTSIKKFILDRLLASGTMNRWDIASTRGQLALDKWKDEHPAAAAHHHPNGDDACWTRLEALEQKVVRRADFPTSMLILHIATEMCYHFEGTASDDDGQVEKHNIMLMHKRKVRKHQQISRELSNYIMYLVFKRDVMLTIKSRAVHDTIAWAEIRQVLPWPSQVNRSNKDATMKLFGEDIQIENEELEEQQQQEQDLTDGVQKQDSTDNEIHQQVAHPEEPVDANDLLKTLNESNQSLKAPVLPQARAVAGELISIKDEAARWNLIAMVWAEMLYYIAPRCGGGFHYDRLSKGGEFATHVLVLMYHLGPFLTTS